MYNCNTINKECNYEKSKKNNFLCFNSDFYCISGFLPAAERKLDSSGRKFYRFGGGKPGGSWFVMVGGLSSYLSAQSDVRDITAIGGGGSLGNNRSARAGDIDLWFTHALTANENWNGTGSFEGQGEYQDFRMLCGVYENLHHWVTLEKSGINSFSDLEARKLISALQEAVVQLMQKIHLKLWGFLIKLMDSIFHGVQAARLFRTVRLMQLL